MVTFSIKYSLTGESESWHDLENADGDTIQVRDLFLYLPISLDYRSYAFDLVTWDRVSTASELMGNLKCLIYTDISSQHSRPIYMSTSFYIPAVTLASLSRTHKHCFVLRMGRKSVDSMCCVNACKRTQCAYRKEKGFSPVFLAGWQH